MDPVTHTLVGATMARAGLDRRTPLAAATLMLAANAPDVDIITSFVGGENSSLALRRGWTHGPPALLVLAIIITLVMVGWDRFVRRRRAPGATPVDAGALMTLAIIGVVSHPLLDWLNIYGVRLLMPLSREWFRGNSVFIIDPYLWAALSLGLILHHRRRADPPRARAAVRASGGVVLIYVALLMTLSRVGARMGAAAASLVGIAPVERVLYSPLPANPLAAELIVQTPDEYQVGSLRWWAGTDRLRFTDERIPRGDWSASIVARAREVESARNYLTWAQFPYVRLEVQGADTAVYFGDARYRSGPVGHLQGVRVTP